MNAHAMNAAAAHSWHNQINTMADVTTKLLDYGALGILVLLLLGGFMYLAKMFLRDRAEMKKQIADMQLEIMKLVEQDKELLISLTKSANEVIAKNTDALNVIASKMDELSEAISDLEGIPQQSKTVRTRKTTLVKTS
jgi:hypothetical protein